MCFDTVGIIRRRIRYNKIMYLIMCLEMDGCEFSGPVSSSGRTLYIKL